VAESDGSAIVVCDAGPLIHLHELGCLDLLSDFREVLVPDAVWAEVMRHRPSALRSRRVRLERVTVDKKRPADLSHLANAFSLAAGEVESLVLMAQRPDAVLLTDDAAARLVAQRLGYDVHGTIGLIVAAIERKRRTKRQVLNLLRSIPRRSTMYVTESLLLSIIDSVRDS
jgi:predicted nucleic acid-binding protein